MSGKNARREIYICPGCQQSAHADDCGYRGPVPWDAGDMPTVNCWGEGPGIWTTKRHPSGLLVLFCPNGRILPVRDIA